MNKRGLWKWIISLCGSSTGKPVERVPLLEIPKDMLSKALEMGVCFHTGPVVADMGDAPFLGPSREGSNSFFISRNFMMNSRDM
jgi:hypothetical protein